MAETLRQKATDRAYLGTQIADALHNAILAELPTDQDILTVHAHRIEQCNNLSNIWLANDLHTADGEAFDGSGRFWNCGSKLCPHCLARQTKRNRSALTGIIAAHKLIVGEHWQFMTLTMPTTDLPLLKARAIMNYAWVLFRKKKWFKATFIGGCKSEEFTLTKRGYHYHMHFIVRSKYVNYNSMRHFWTEALRAAFERSGKALSIATTDGLAIANIRKIGSLSEAINEVAKYITKATGWKRLNTVDLLDVARIERWPRMFELFGSFRSFPSGVADLEDDNSEDKTILDTKHLSDGDPETGWRAHCRALGVERYLDKLQVEINDQSCFRMQQLRFHYQAASFWRIKPKIPLSVDDCLNRLKALDIRRDGKPWITGSFRPNKYGSLVNLSTGKVVNYSNDTDQTTWSTDDARQQLQEWFDATNGTDVLDYIDR